MGGREHAGRRRDVIGFYLCETGRRAQPCVHLHHISKVLRRVENMSHESR